MPRKVIPDPLSMQAQSLKWHLAKKKIGFVPTMGALHEGHLQLVRLSKKFNDVTVVSIYVNPLQFGPQEDFKEYPRTFQRDLDLLKKEKINLLFTPNDSVMYPEGFSSKILISGPLVQGLCAPYRPGHFDGVATVVVKLLEAVRPTRLYLGQKDAQQAILLRQVIRDFNLPVETVICPIVREQDGLAMSSRNARLTPRGRRSAPIIYRALQAGKSIFDLGETQTKKVLGEIRKVLREEKNLKLQYLEAVETKLLQPVEELKSGTLLVLAAFIDDVRLIDNIIL